MLLGGEPLGTVALGELPAAAAVAAHVPAYDDVDESPRFSRRMAYALRERWEPEEWLAAWAATLAINASDTLAPAITDALATLAVSLTVSDTLAPGVSDASALLAALSASDTLGTGITDTAQIFATLAAADALDVRIVDASALLAALSASDTMTPGIADTAVVLVQMSAVDTVAVSISDVALVDILAATPGHMVAIITVRPALAGDVSADAALAAAPDVKPGIGGKPTLH